MTENIVYVGKKGLMPYVMAVSTHINRGANEVVVKARGKNISKAADIVEIAKRQIDGLELDNIVLQTEEMPPREGEKGTSNVSVMSFYLKK